MSMCGMVECYGTEIMLVRDVLADLVEWSVFKYQIREKMTFVNSDDGMNRITGFNGINCTTLQRAMAIKRFALAE